MKCSCFIEVIFPLVELFSETFQIEQKDKKKKKRKNPMSFGTNRCTNLLFLLLLMPFTATWMDLEISILSEVSQTEKDKYHMISLICGI